MDVITQQKYYTEAIIFLKKATCNFDTSHDWVHGMNVCQRAVDIMLSFGIEFDEKLVVLTALLHDVRDHKYKDIISHDEMVAFLESQYYKNDQRIQIILDIIDNVSFSKEVSGKLKIFDFPYNIYRDAVSDGDKIEALGMRAIDRCIAFNTIHLGIDDIEMKKILPNICRTRLLCLLPGGYIRTKKGKLCAQPLHDELEQYLKILEN